MHVYLGQPNYFSKTTNFERLFTYYMTGLAIGIGKWDDHVLGMYGEREWLGFVLMRCHIAGGLFIGKI